MDRWELALLELVKTDSRYDPPEMYCLKDFLKAKYNQPYFPEKEADEQSAKNAIRIRIDGESKPVEISTMLDRLKPLTESSLGLVRYYVPKVLRDEAKKLRKNWKNEP